MRNVVYLIPILLAGAITLYKMTIYPYYDLYSRKSTNRRASVIAQNYVNLGLDPKNTVHGEFLDHFLLANAYHRFWPDDAVKEYKQSISLLPSNRFGYQIGFLLFGLNRFTEAIEYLALALKHHPNSEMFSFVRALCYVKLGKWDDALEDLDSVIDIDPVDDTAALCYRLKADIFDRLNRPDDVEENMDLAYSINPSQQVGLEDILNKYDIKFK